MPAADDDVTVNAFFFFFFSLALSLNHCNVMSNWEDPFLNGSPKMSWVDEFLMSQILCLDFFYC